jgi:hypothetical protein
MPYPTCATCATIATTRGGTIDMKTRQSTGTFRSFHSIKPIIFAAVFVCRTRGVIVISVIMVVVGVMLRVVCGCVDVCIG